MPTLSPILAFSVWYLALWVVLGVVCVVSLVALRFHWVQRRPMSRCVLLSVAAHALLIGLASSIRFVSLPPGGGQDAPVRVTIVSLAPQDVIEAPDTPPSASEVEEQPTEEHVAPELIEASEEKPEERIVEKTEEKPAESVKVESPPQEANMQAEAEAPPEPEVTAEPVVAETPPTESPQEVADAAPVEPETVVEQTPPTPATQVPAQPVAATVPLPPALPASLADRVAPNRLQSVIEHGGSVETEQAVGRALEWLAMAQAADGRWDADRWGAGREMMVLGHNRKGAGGDADTGITALALLTFLGAGHSHLEGSYQDTVARGLVFLIRSQDARGCLSGESSFYARTYCHSMATFALAEAFALTKDKRLEPYVVRAVEHLLAGENKTVGGWRYNDDGRDQGDVSQLGWVIMALRSAELSGVRVPDETWTRIDGFLARVARGRHGGLAAYQVRTDWSRSMTAEAMYCRQVLGRPLASAGQVEALDALEAELPGDGSTNYYYWYYAALALHHAQNDGSAARHTWNRWNDRMKRELVNAQVTDGSNAGSWSPNTVWGGYGGRVYTTAMAAMCLEVYYRYGSPAAGRSPWVASQPREGVSNR
ncbi:hypothetical protein [Aeoliella sp. SH292]|uniref:prenyltransferase/squalene oxidase repeat-containing protein n=1 Tax=Aeoliella sp. SH292 TaxID=3454464 RepID=UPI003F94D7B8